MKYSLRKGGGFEPDVAVEVVSCVWHSEFLKQRLTMNKRQGCLEDIEEPYLTSAENARWGEAGDVAE